MNFVVPCSNYEKQAVCGSFKGDSCYTTMPMDKGMAWGFALLVASVASKRKGIKENFAHCF